MRRISMVRSIVWSVTLILIAASLSLASAAPRGDKGKPGGGDGGGQTCTPDSLFPALIYPVSSAANNGTYNLAVASSDGCVKLILELSIQLGGVRLKYDEITQSGYYAWSENVYPGYPPGTIKRQHFTVTGGVLTRTSLETLYEGIGYQLHFDLQGDLLAVVDEVSGEQTLLVIDVSACDGGLPCNDNDGVAVYKPSVNCLSGIAIAGCFRPEPALTMALSGDTIYFDVHGQDTTGTRIYGIAQVAKGAGGWAPQTPELFLRDDNYREVHISGGLSADGRYLAIGYAGGSQRVIILDTTVTGGSCPCEAAGFSQNFPAWAATWTADETMYVLGTEGKGRNLRFPIQEFDPATGMRTSLGISLNDHPWIDSSL
jgi:hypothetical protein